MPTPDICAPTTNPFYKVQPPGHSVYRRGHYGPPLYGEYREKYITGPALPFGQEYSRPSPIMEWMRPDGSRAMHGLGGLGDTVLPTLDLSVGGATGAASQFSTQAKVSFGAAAVAVVAGLLLWKKSKVGAGIALGGAAAATIAGFYLNAQGASAVQQQQAWNTTGGPSTPQLAGLRLYR